MTMDSTASLAFDTQSLGQLKAKAHHNSDQALKEAAQQFEAVFLNMMMKSMRATTGNSELMDNEHTRMFTGMLDQQLSQSMSQRGVGLAEMLVQQLSHDPEQPRTMIPAPANVFYQSGYSTSARELDAISVDGLMEGGPKSFVQRMLPEAQQVSRETGVPVALMLGQAALESGWGRREIKMADGSDSHNLFGIKATGGWQGRSTDIMTTEYRHGVPHKQVESFRAYDSYADAFRDYARLMTENPRYSEVLQQNTVQQMAAAVQRAGYATDPAYADKLIKVMDMMQNSSD